MNTVTFSLILTITGAVIGFISSVSGNFVIGGIATVCAVVGAFLQYYVSKPFILNFQESDWTPLNDQFILSIPAHRHKRRHEIVSTVYLVNGGLSEVVMCDEVEKQDGSFIVGANKPFTGRLVLK